MVNVLEPDTRLILTRLNTPRNTFASDASSTTASHPPLSDVNGARNSGQSTISPSLSTVPGHQELEFPAALFLDIDCFVWAGLQMPDLSVGIPTVRSTPNACGMGALYFILFVMYSVGLAVLFCKSESCRQGVPQLRDGSCSAIVRNKLAC